jgi:hypothetical protein
MKRFGLMITDESGNLFGDGSICIKPLRLHKSLGSYIKFI